MRRSLVPRYYKYEDWPEPEATGGLKYGQIITLTQIVKTANEQKVPTLSKQEYFLQFCPDRGTGDRWGDVSVCSGEGRKEKAGKDSVCTGEGNWEEETGNPVCTKEGREEEPAKVFVCSREGREE